MGVGQEIRHGCQFLHSLIRALGHLPGGLSRFIPCHPGAHHARLSHLGWGRYGHGLFSCPRESCDYQILAPLLNFFGYPDGAATELFNGTLKLRYSSTPFSKKLPSWSGSDLSGYLPVVGPGPGPSVHFLDHDPVFERPAKRFRIIGKSSVHKRELCSGDGLPTPKRWKRLVPQGTGSMRISTPFSKKLPSWSVSDLSGYLPVVGPGPGPSVHFLDHDPVFERPAKRFRIIGKSSVHKRELCSGDGLPTPKRWKRLVPPGTGLSRIEDDVPPFLFPRTGVG